MKFGYKNSRERAEMKELRTDQEFFFKPLKFKEVACLRCEKKFKTECDNNGSRIFLCAGCAENYHLMLVVLLCWMEMERGC